MAKKKNAWALPMDKQGRPIVDAYLRMSDGFDEKEDTKENHLEQITRLIERQGWVLGEVLVDEVSAWKRNVRRPDWERLLVRIENGATGGVVFYHQDRLMRQPWDLERLFNLVEDGREALNVASVHGKLNLMDPTQRFLMRNLVSHACMSSDDTSRRLRDKYAGRRKRGVLIDGGPRPFGWFREGADAELVRREQEALRWAFDFLLNDGGLAEETMLCRDGITRRVRRKGGLTEVARRWNTAGLLSYYGNEWNAVTVRQTMSKQRHAGRIEHDGEKVTDIVGHEPVIDPEVFDQVQAIFAGRRRGRPNSGRSLGSGIIVCSNCGEYLVSRPRYAGGGRKVAAYKCAPPKGCGSIGMDQEPVDAMLRSLAIGQLSSPAVAERVSKVAVEQNETIAGLREALTTARRTEVNLTVRNATGELSDEAFNEGHKAVSRRVKRLEELLADAQEIAGDVGHLEAESKREVTQRWDAAAASGDTEGLRAMLKSALRLDSVQILPGFTGPRSDRQAVPPMERVSFVPSGGVSGNTTTRVEADSGVA